MIRMLCPDETVLLEDSLIGLISDDASEMCISDKQLSVQKGQIKAVLRR